jgi:hypothetical protein
MKQHKSFLLLFIMGVIIFPWQSICVTHPLGHNTIAHDGPSHCETHRIYAHKKGVHLLPPMHCEHIASVIGEYNQTQADKIVTSNNISSQVVISEQTNYSQQGQSFILIPEPKCRSATLLSDIPLRAPPFI